MRRRAGHAICSSSSRKVNRAKPNALEEERMLLHTRTLVLACAFAVPSVSASAGPGADTIELPPAIADRTAAELTGTPVENRRGTVIGTLDAIVRTPAGRLFGIVRPGDLAPGVLRGQGFALADFERAGEHLVAPTNGDATMLDDGRIWTRDIYRPVPRDVPLLQLAGSKPMVGPEAPEPMRPFSDLDLDHDGVLTPSEAHSSPRLGDSWAHLDTNQDGVIDRSEFRALPGAGAAPTAEEANR
jgi:hypothetical protein